ncbi:Hypothetical protein SFBmNL_01163 [Candidatus Arthromitus sp. SFB-mouse-NL]|uniref:hypothetical protein n=1 Tax=Candidatus Arthromitus sp. SFB-mouse-NL TaxID=1508644 RepID=UPI00049A29A4|nr:hypothetical protein [Candidatus Arthromitus sp. SFB-mouse-NL]AID45068.1 Hypothetical protein SFBmNL_01163 [Candidatus Arthromitus sp. SFB-mouse-NL]
MLHKKKVNAIKCMLSTLVAGPIAFNILATQSEKANASIRGTASVVSRTVQRPLVTNVRYRLTPQEKTLGGIGLSVSIVGAVGTAVGLGLTQSQYHQSEKVQKNIIENTYDAYYEEREKYMQNLFNSWGVAMPEKYKNPIAKPESTPEVKPGFSIGTEG